MSLEMFWQPVRVISWLLPTTYGTIPLRDVALPWDGSKLGDPGWSGRHRPGFDAHFLAVDAPPDHIIAVRLTFAANSRRFMKLHFPWSQPPDVPFDRPPGGLILP
jgi:hypothetical protein